MPLGRACTGGLFCLHLEQGNASAHAISQTPESQGNHRRAGASARGGALGEAVDVSPGVSRAIMEKETHPCQELSAGKEPAGAAPGGIGSGCSWLLAGTRLRAWWTPAAMQGGPRPGEAGAEGGRRRPWGGGCSLGREPMAAVGATSPVFLVRDCSGAVGPLRISGTPPSDPTKGRVRRCCEERLGHRPPRHQITALSLNSSVLRPSS